MKRYENPKDEELQRNIDEQEKAMSALLVRVMERPLTPLHETIQELRSQIDAVQKASIHAAKSVEAGLSEALEGQTKRLNRHVGDVADGVDTLKNELSALASTLEKRHGGQLERDGQMQDKLAQAGDLAAAAILDILLVEEEGHVEIGNRWFFHLCAQQGLEPMATYDALTVRYKAPVLKGPFNIEARRRAGFSEAELARFG